MGLCLMSCFWQEKLAHSTHMYDASQSIEKPFFFPYVSKPQQLSLLAVLSLGPRCHNLRCSVVQQFLHPTHPHLQPPLYFLYLTQLTFCRISLQTFRLAIGKLTAHTSLSFILRPGACIEHESSSLPLSQSWLLYKSKVMGFSQYLYFSVQSA